MIRGRGKGVRQWSAADRERLARQVEPVRTSVTVLFFAQGTRSRNGDLLPFKKGCLAPPDQTWVKPGRVGVVIGAPMPHLSDPSRPREERLSELRAVVEELRREADRLRG